jgi:hypothetical protein
MNVGFIIGSINLRHGLLPNFQSMSDALRFAAIAVSGGLGWDRLGYFKAIHCI